jgi:hypothetical protein
MPEDISTRTATAIAIAGVLGTLLGATVSPLVNYLTSKREMDAKMVEPAIGILNGPAPNANDSEVMRSWAIDLIETGTGKAFTQPRRDVLIRQGLPVRPGGGSGLLGGVLGIVR